MTKSQKKLTCLCVMSILMAIFIVCSVVFFVNGKKTSALTINEEFVQGDLSFNTNYELPTRNYTLNGETKQAKTLLVSPSGLVYDYKNIILNEVGAWQVKFVVDFDKTYVDAYKFSVYNSLFEVTGKGGAISYGNSQTFPDKATLNVTVPKGQKFICNDVIDLSGLTRNDTLIRIGMNPRSNGSEEVTRLTVCLTDIYDPDNSVFINFQMFEHSGDTPDYLVLSTLTASYSGESVELGHSSTKIDGTRTFFSNYYKWGTYTSFSFRGIGRPGMEEMTSLAFDYENMQVHTLDKLYAGDGATGADATLIADLKDLNYENAKIYGSDWGTGYPGYSNPFKGFTSGEVYLSVYAADNYYISSEVNFSISEIYGIDLTANKSFDNAKPFMKIDMAGYEIDNLPVGCTGTPYKLFDATAIDSLNKNVIVSKNVYLMKGNTRLIDVTVNDNYFIPEYAGVYEIRYVADDGSGNVAEQSLYITVYDELRGPSIQFAGEYETEAICGEKVVLPKVKVTSNSGIAGVSNYVSFGKSVIVRNADSFVPKAPGEYTVVFLASDYLDKKTALSYTVLVEKADKPIIEVEPLLPYGFIAGEKYTLNDAFALDYSDSDSMVKAKKYIVEDGVEREINGEFEAKKTASGNVKVKYVYTSATGVTTYEKELPVISINNFETDLIKYFVNENVIKEQFNDFVLLKFQGNAEERFIKSIPVNSTEFSFNVYAQSNDVLNNANAITLTFKDVAIANRELKIKIVKGSESSEYSTLYINDASPVSIRGNFFGSKQNFDFMINAKDGELTVGTTKYVISNYVDGTKFDGFTDGKAYLTIGAEGYDTTLDKDFGVSITKLANTFLSKIPDDFIGPEITVNGSVKSKYSIGETVRSLTAIATDVLQENTEITLTVTLVNGSTIEDVYSNEGKLLRNVSPEYVYNFTLNKSGIYQAYYRATDSKGNSSNITIAYIVSADDTAPVIELSDVKDKYALNTAISLPVAKISDNLSTESELSCYLVVKRPDGTTEVINYKNGISELKTEYSFDVTGKWELTWVATDKCNNVQFKTIAVSVEG